MRGRLTTAIAHSSRSGHLSALTGLRFFLALWVIVTHLIGTGHVYEPVVLILPGPLQDLIRRGYQAVPTFFVLSGFVLARTYGPIEWNRANFWKYLVGRFARVYPVYLLSLLIVSPFIVRAQDRAERLAGGDAPDTHPGMVRRPLHRGLEYARVVAVLRDVLLPDLSSVDHPDERPGLATDDRRRAHGLRTDSSDVDRRNL